MLYSQHAVILSAATTDLLFPIYYAEIVSLNFRFLSSYIRCIISHTLFLPCRTHSSSRLDWGWEGPSVLQRCRTETTCSPAVSQNKWKQWRSTDRQKATEQLQCGQSLRLCCVSFNVDQVSKPFHWGVINLTVWVQVRWRGQGKHGAVLVYVGFTTYSLRVWDHLHQGYCTHS